MPNIKKKKRIFLLTDGAVNNANEIIQLAKLKNDENRVHTFGVGYGCSKFLVKELANAGRGSHSFIEETDNLKGKVIKALSKAIEPSLSNCVFTLTTSPTLETPFGGIIGEAFRNDLIT